MKKNLLFVFAISALLFSSCGGGAVETKEAAEVNEVVTDVEYTVSASESSVKWEGSKLAYSHDGLITISSGSLKVTEGNLVGGSFVIDMNTITNRDVESAEDNAKLVGHLKSADFFDVENNPTAEFVITKIEGSNVSGNLTILGNTNEITFPATINVSDAGVEAKAEFTINRTLWNIKWGSESVVDWGKDKVISDNIKFNVSLVAKS
jgi:polyisoprenoid-binding protein YceI